MSDDPPSKDEPQEPNPPGWTKHARALLQLGSAVPFAGGVFSAAAGYWSEHEQAQMNEFLCGWLKMIQDELREKERTIADVATRLDMQDEQISARVRSDEYQSLMKKAFRNWAGTESRKKQEYIRNILTNAAATDLTSDDVVRLFLDWLGNYSEFHFAVIADIYQNPGATRGQIWQRRGKGRPREDSAEADLYKLLFRDLSTGGVIRQHRETDYAGNFIAKRPAKPSGRSSGSRQMTSAFDDEDQYELTALGDQFVHYAMTELTPKIEYHPDIEEDSNAQ